MKVLIVEDEHKIANSLKKGLEQEGIVTDLAYDGESGYDLASEGDYDVIVLDLMLPKMTGEEICNSLRHDQVHTPILILTAKGGVSDKVTNLNQGADDYLTKPFVFEELLARVRALARRPDQMLSAALVYEDLILDTTTFQITRSGKSIALSRKEFALLEYLLRHPNQVISKQQIIDHVWNYETDILPNTVEVYIGYLRKKIDQPFPKQPALINTVRGFGYRLGKD